MPFVDGNAENKKQKSVAPGAEVVAKPKPKAQESAAGKRSGKPTEPIVTLHHEKQSSLFLGVSAIGAGIFLGPLVSWGGAYLLTGEGPYVGDTTTLVGMGLATLLGFLGLFFLTRGALEWGRAHRGMWSQQNAIALIGTWLGGLVLGCMFLLFWGWWSFISDEVGLYFSMAWAAFFGVGGIIVVSVVLAWMRVKS